MGKKTVEQKAAEIGFTSEAQRYLDNSVARDSGQRPDLNLQVPSEPELAAREKASRDTSTLTEMLPAAFRADNITGGILRNIDDKHRIDPAYTGEVRDASIKELTAEVPEEYWNRFTGTSRADDEQTLNKIHQDIQDEETLKRGGLVGLGIRGGAMLLDPVGAGLFGAEAKLLGTFVSKGNRAFRAATHAGASIATGNLYTALLHDQHGSTMDAEDVLYTSALFGVGGGLVGALSKNAVKMNAAVRDAQAGVRDALDEQLLKDTVVDHVPMTPEEALSRAIDEHAKLPEDWKNLPEYADKIHARRDALLRQSVPSSTDGHTVIDAKGNFTYTTDNVHIRGSLQPDGEVYIATAEKNPASSARGQYGKALDSLVQDIRAAGHDVKVVTGDSSPAAVAAKSKYYGDRHTITGEGSHGTTPTSVDFRDTNFRHSLSTTKATKLEVDPETLLTQPDNSLGMFARAREAVAQRFREVTQNDGSTIGMFNVVGTGEKGASKVERAASAEATPENILAEHAVKESAAASDKLTEHARQLRAAGAFKGAEESTVGKIQTKPGRFAGSDSSFVLGLQSDEAKSFAYDILENGTGVINNPGSAALKKQHIETVLLSHAQPQFKEFERVWRIENGKTGWKNFVKGDFYEAMDKELRTEMELRGNAHAKGVEHISPFSENTQKMADALDRANGHAVDMRASSGEHLADAIVKRPGYVQLLWNGRAMREAMKVKGLPEAYKKAYAESVAELTGMPMKEANQISKQVWLRAVTNELGLDANPHALLSRDSREYFRQMLVNNGSMSDHEITSLLERVDASMADAGASSRVKRRTSVDLLSSFEHEGKQYQLLDLVDNDMQALHQRYIGEAAGRSALAQKGILGHGIASESDWTAYRTAILEGMGKAGDTPDNIEHMKKVIAGTYDQLLSRPVGQGVDRNARRLMNLTGLSLLGQIGMPQVAEFGQILGSHGLQSMWETLPELQKFRKAIKNGTVDEGLIADIMPYTGRLWDEHVLYPKRVRLEDKLGRDSYWLTQVDRLTASASEFSGWMSGMYSIKRFQQQWDVLLQTHKMAQYLKGIEFAVDGSYKATGKFAGQEARLANIGWDAAFFKRLKSVEQHFEWEDGILQRLHTEKWHDPVLVNDFAEGIHKHTSQIIQKSLIGESHVWMHSTLGAMLTQLRSYPIVGLEKQSLRGIHFKDSVSFYTAMYGLGLSSIVQAAKSASAAQGKNEADKRKYLDAHLGTAGLLKGSLAYASSVSVLPELLNVAGSVIPGAKDLVSTQATRMGGTRGLNPSLSDIPSLGFAISGVNALSAGAHKIVDPSYKLSKSETRAMRYITPMGTAHGITQTLNVLDAELRD